MELYHGQKLFDDVTRELSQRGFRFIDFSDGASLGKTDRPKRIWADALFVRKALDGEQLLKAAAILMELDYVTDAEWMLRDADVDSQRIRSMVGAWRAAPVERPERPNIPRNFRNVLRFLMGKLPVS